VRRLEFGNARHVTEDPAQVDLLAFWFGHEPDDAAVAAQKRALWWEKDAAVDAAIAERFGALHAQAAHGALDGWARTPRGRLALILLLDQISRHLYRDTAHAFAQDSAALALCREGLERSEDRQLRPVERLFFYLPLEHAEVLEAQRESLAQCEALRDEVPAAWRDLFQHHVDFARRHLEVIERFGRFPHRNAALGRASTAAERNFLATPGSSF